jgi:hypothetical protein
MTLPSRRAGLGALGLLLGACQPPLYRQPDMTAPHAVVKVRVIHHQVPGPNRDASLRLNGLTVPLPAQADLKEAATVAVRVQPEASTWALATDFYHQTSRQESYMQSESYACGTQTTGYGSTASTTTRYCTRNVTKYRTVTERISDGACQASLQHVPEVGGMYLLQYDFYGGGQCSMKCFRQKPAENGEFELSPCVTGATGG